MLLCSQLQNLNNSLYLMQLGLRQVKNIMYIDITTAINFMLSTCEVSFLHRDSPMEMQFIFTMT